MDMKGKKAYMEEEKKTTPKKKTSKVVICNASADDARMALEEVVRQYLFKKALELNGDIA